MELENFLDLEQIRWAKARLQAGNTLIEAQFNDRRTHSWSTSSRHSQSWIGHSRSNRRRVERAVGRLDLINEEEVEQNAVQHANPRLLNQLLNLLTNRQPNSPRTTPTLMLATMLTMPASMTTNHVTEAMIEIEANQSVCFVMSCMNSI